MPREKFTIWLCAALLLKPIDSFSAPLRKHHAYSKDCSWVMILAQKERHPGLLLTQASPLHGHLKLSHCRAPAIYFYDLLLNCCAREEACSAAQRGPEMTDLGDFKFLKAPASRSRQTGTLSYVTADSLATMISPSDFDWGLQWSLLSHQLHPIPFPSAGTPSQQPRFVYFVSAWKYITQYMLGGIPCHFWVLSPPLHWTGVSVALQKAGPNAL